MPTEIVTTKWKCNKCGATYDTEASASNCENSHTDPKDEDEYGNKINPIISMKYTYKEKYPKKIGVLMKDETTQNYNLED
jgi:hypothetical protein